MQLTARLATAAFLLVTAQKVFAHGAFKGIGSFYGGVLHPAVVPAHLIALLAIGLFVGQRGWDYTVKALPLFIAACVVGLALSRAGIEQVAQIVLLAGAAIAGVLVAGDVRVPAGLGLMLMAVVGFVVALDSAPDALAGADRFAALAGTCIGVSAAFIWISGPVTSLTSRWQHLGIRVAGSWVSASALLVLALAASGKSSAGG